MRLPVVLPIADVAVHCDEVDEGRGEVRKGTALVSIERIDATRSERESGLLAVHLVKVAGIPERRVFTVEVVASA